MERNGISWDEKAHGVNTTPVQHENLWSALYNLLLVLNTVCFDSKLCNTLLSVIKNKENVSHLVGKQKHFILFRWGFFFMSALNRNKNRTTHRTFCGQW